MRVKLKMYKIVLQIMIKFIVFGCIAFGQQPFMYTEMQDTLLPVTTHIPDTNFTLMSHALPNNPQSELIYGNHLYLGAGTIIQIYELGEDGIPIFTGQAYTRGLIHDLEHDGEYLYIANARRGITIFEGDNFIDPSELGHYQTESVAARIGVSGDSLFYFESNSLGIVDITDRTNPELVRIIPQDSLTILGHSVNDFYFYQDYLITTICLQNPYWKGYLGILDLRSQSGIPEIADTIYLPGSMRYEGFKLYDDRLYIFCHDSLMIYQINSASHFQHFSTVEFSGSFCGFDEEYINESRMGYLSQAYIFHDEDSVHTKIYEILLDDLNNPQLSDSSVITPNTFYRDLVQDNNYTYAICHHGWYSWGYDPGLYVYGWSDNSGGELLHHERLYSFCTAVAAKEDVAYAGTYYENVTILDMLDKTNPQIVGEIPGFTYVVQMKIIDDRLYVLTPAKLTIFDITDPFTPVELGRLYLQQGGYGINFHIHNNLVYINYWWISPQMYGCILIADISDPSDMTVYFDEDLYGSPNPSHLNYPILFLLSYHGYMTIYDVSDSTDPYYYCTEEMNLGSSSCYARDTLLYMFGSCYELLDISNLRSPERIDYWNIGSRYDDVQLVDGQLFMADCAGGNDVLVWDIDASPLEPYHVGFYRGNVLGFMSIDLPYVYVPGGEYGLITLRFDDPTGIEDEKTPVPDATEFLTAYPNPFNSTVNFHINNRSSNLGELKIYDVAGRLVKSIDISDHEMLSTVTWDGTNSDGAEVSTGVYFAKYNDVNSSQTVKIVLLK